MRTQSQKRSEYALCEVKEIMDIIDSQKMKKEFKSLCAGIPSMILQNGFGQTMAFLLSKGKKDKYHDVYHLIHAWLGLKQGDTQNSFIESNNPDKPEELIMELSKMEQRKYQKAQSEALYLLEWVKRFAAAFCMED